jgi:hypothetical protein
MFDKLRKETKETKETTPLLNVSSERQSGELAAIRGLFAPLRRRAAMLEITQAVAGDSMPGLLQVFSSLSLSG